MASPGAAPKLHVAPSAALVGKEHARASRRSARAKASVDYNEEADTAAVGREEGDGGATGLRAVRQKPGGKTKRSKDAEAVELDIETHDVTVTARTAARGAVKRRKPREDFIVDVEELLEESVEAAEAATPVRQKKARKKAPAAAAGEDEDIPPKAKQKRARKKAATSTEEPAAAGEGDESAPAPKQKRVRKKAGAAEDDESAVLVDLPTTVPAGKLVGCHVSAAGGVERALVNAVAVGAKAFAMDTRSKRRWECPALKRTTAAAFRSACNAFGFSAAQILPHGSYLINLGSPDEEMLRKSYAAFLEELQRCETLGIKLYNIHPGHTNSGGETSTPEQCMDLIASCINRAHGETTGVTVVLENVAGQGSSVGHSFEQLRYMINRVEDQSRIGVCLDTCHMFAAGYDLATPAAYAATMQRFDDVVGLRYLKGMHINDSKCALGSRRDRHENVGRGMIGITMFECIMDDPRLDGIPLIMETPVQEAGPAINYKKSLLAGELVLRDGEDDAKIGTDKRDIALLYSLCK
ncbi:probable endonuclease 4 at C-terminar half [Coccomyxa sp. Obi]|nr:probable endonuclease 4 at C-terminar half [Coccomyxa sp. Obi]